MDDGYILLGELSAVLDEPANTLAQMLKRGGFSLPDADCRGGTGNWTKFSMADVAALALIRSLTNLGMQVRNASEATQYIIEVGKVELTDLDRFIARWRNARMVIGRRDRRWSFSLFENMDHLNAGSAYITLDVARVVESAIQRAREFVPRRERRRA